ncbi:tRNA (guanosine(46)-N7)-methyltransferase TrmB [Buchnera aphidicola]|uniref:tRNA (guanine-N(7)-)-methyltransferase n=1 Tax=Buchnera aphidicola subsp. Tuberolachnus salignus TaxID=98804 RepID=A0A160SWS3_BUCTT|nr:tRNA (guanosine(46)-N7)-methyltransferase TrmB [Buchnera aphidicola]CUR53342.1 tRNA (guanine-N(7)-)-methyltransferase [Buchnera aphidicola (Tuberolachnus salignus)]
MLSCDDIFDFKKKITFQTIKSFVCRNRSLKRFPIQKFQFLWKKNGINFQKKNINFTTIFSNDLPIILNIGFGNGKDFCQMSAKNTNNNFLGIEVYRTSIFSCLKYLQNKSLDNMRLVFHDVYDVIKYMLPNSSIFIVQIFFPDPWPKIRHHKRRLIQENFLKIIFNKIIVFGYIHIKTDSFSYSQHIQYLFLQQKNFFSACLKDKILLSSFCIKKTKFEKKSIKLGHQTFEHIYQIIK